jgi:hypothetical protein
MVVIRRQLPRTNGAGLATVGLSHRRGEDSPLPCATPAADRLCLYRSHEFIAGYASGGSPNLLGLCTLELAADRPDEPSNSRPSAVTTFCLGLPRASNER